MKKIALRISILSLPLMAVLLLFEVGLQQVENSYKIKQELIKASRSDTTVVILGSSHGILGFDPQFFDYSGLNLASLAQSLYYDDQILKAVFASKTDLKVVLIPISYFSLSYDLSNSPGYMLTYYYERFNGFPLEGNFHPFDLRRFSLFALYGNWDSLLMAMKGFHNPQELNIAPNGAWAEPGFDYTKALTHLTPANGQFAVREHDLLFHQDVRVRNIHLLREMVELCQKNGVIPVMITTPVHPTYSTAMDQSAWNETLVTLSELSQEYQIPYFNYLLDKRFFDGEFRDSNHLNPRGVKKFSAIVNDEVLKPLLGTPQTP